MNKLTSTAPWQTKTIVATELDGTEMVALCIILEVKNEDIDPVSAIKQATAEFLATEEGEEALEETNDCFNWGDVLDYIPESVLLKYGVRIVASYTADSTVDLNEQFV